MKMNNKYRLAALVLSLLFFLYLPASIGAQELKTELSVRVLPGDYFGGLVPGKSKTIYIEIRNSGGNTLHNINFRASLPENWLVVFRPENLDFLAPGISNIIEVDITPAFRSERGDYTLNVIAEALEVRSATYVYLQVKGSSGYWLWIGVGITLAVVTGFVFVYRREGRK